MAGIYIHIPFCKSKCVYCDFYSVVCDAGIHSDFISALQNELISEKKYLGDVAVRTIYFGGGTPSLCSPEQIQNIIDTIKKNWDCSSLGEVTIEANPDDLSESYIEKLVRTDVNRISIGVQSFSDWNLQAMNRRHTSFQAIKAVKDVKKSGFNNVTIDLIYGIPGVSSNQWRDDLQQALELGVEHISAYHLTVEEDTGLGRMAREGKFFPVPEEVSEEQYSILHEVLTSGGFEHYEISNFAKPGFRAMHNSSYWNGEYYLGVGPSAHSYNGTTRRRCGCTISEYITCGGKGIEYEREELTPEDRYNEYIMVSLRRMEGLDEKELKKRFKGELYDFFISSVREFLNKELVLYENGYYHIPPEKFLLSDNIISGLFKVE